VGAATSLAVQGQNLGSIALLIGVFGIRASLPLAILGSLSRASLLRLRGRLRSAKSTGKVLLGTLLIAFGVLALTGLDKTLETALLSASPAWLTTFTTSL
jgi:cytochrome c-type biogenesis protein